MSPLGSPLRHRPPPVDRISALRTWTRNHWPSLAVALWLSGILLLVIRLLTGVGRVRRLHRSAQPAPDDCQALLHQVTADLGLSSKVDLAIVRDLNSPLLHGLRRPTIYLPQRLIRRDNPSELTAIFAHELAHLASHDLLWLRVARWISILLWPHPLAWRLPAAHAAVCEEVSDRAAANYIKDPMSYSRTLARAALAMVGHTRVEMGIPMARTSDIGRRLRALTRKVDASPLARRSMALSLLAGAITLGLVGGIRLVYAETTPEADRPASTAVAPGERLLRFPADRALGRLMIRHAHEPMRKPQTYFYNPTFEENWTFLAAAQGDVIIPSDSKVRLELNTDGGRDLRPLAALKPDDLDAFGWGYCSLEPTDDDVRQITRLTGLTQIDLQVSVRGMDGTDPCRLSAPELPRPRRPAESGVPHAPLSRLRRSDERTGRHARAQASEFHLRSALAPGRRRRGCLRRSGGTRPRRPAPDRLGPGSARRPPLASPAFACGATTSPTRLWSRSAGCIPSGCSAC